MVEQMAQLVLRLAVEFLALPWVSTWRCQLYTVLVFPVLVTLVTGIVPDDHPFWVKFAYAG